jgi:phage/plasmid-like protein (TIGR03299 family)
MTRETLSSLNTHTLIGHTDARGTAWHYRADLQGAEPNHYPGAIPVADVSRRLFAWDAQSRPIAVERPCDVNTMTHLDVEGRPAKWVTVDSRQAIVRSDRNDGHVMGIFTDSYEPHPYRTWLLETVADVLDDDLSISSAGLLRDGAIAWVEVSVPETITTDEGVQFRPNLLATTTFDGSLATTYKRTITDVVCDNTRAAALAEDSPTFRVRHSRNSGIKLADARDALAIIHDAADGFTADVARLCATPVSNATFSRFLDAWVPQAAPNGQPLTGRALTLAEKTRSELAYMWTSDARVAPWSGTAHGVIQAVNTYQHHTRPVRGTTRTERNMLRTVTGDFDTVDHAAYAALTRVLATT